MSYSGFGPMLIEAYRSAKTWIEYRAVKIAVNILYMMQQIGYATFFIENFSALGS
jgi:hypothetical protein